MSINFNNDNTTKILNVRPDLSVLNATLVPVHESAAIPGSSDVAGIELRILPPFIKDNHTMRVWPFPGKAKLYFLTMVISDVPGQLNGLMDINTFPRIGKGEWLPINQTIFYWEKETAADQAPNQLHMMCAVIKSKEALRETGSILASVREDTEYKDLMQTLAAVINDASSYSLVTNITLQVARIVGRYLGRVDDKPIGTVINSFTRLHGDWDMLGITPIHVETKNVNFSFELIVRDNDRLTTSPYRPPIPISDLPSKKAA
jgi:hypothetical protein